MIYYQLKQNAGTQNIVVTVFQIIFNICLFLYYFFLITGMTMFIYLFYLFGLHVDLSLDCAGMKSTGQSILLLRKELILMHTRRKSGVYYFPLLEHALL